jgi:flagellar basal body rod protein FlgB
MRRAWSGRSFRELVPEAASNPIQKNDSRGELDGNNLDLDQEMVKVEWLLLK